MEATAASERKRHSTHHSHLGGPREHAPVKRRPLPATVATSVSAPPIIIPSDPAAAPAPERIPRGFQTPPQTAAPFSPDDFNSFAQPPMDELGYGYPVQPVGHPSPYSRRGSIAPPHALRSSQEFRARRQSHLEMPHAHSAPIIPHYHHDPDVGMDRLTQYPPELPPLDGYDYDEPQFAPYGAAYRNLQPTVEDEDDAAPPPPPAHRASAPAVPGVTMPSEYPPETAMVPQSPHFLQDPYAYPPEDAIRPPSSGDPYAIPSALVPGSAPARAAHHHRMSIGAYPSSGGYSPTSYPAEYQPPQWPTTQSPLEYGTPPNYPPHPMSHAEFAPAYYPTAAPEPMPLARRPVSPGVSPSRHSRIAVRSIPNRKSVSPRPQTSDGASRNHFSPDSFEVLNPAARNSMYNLHGSNPHSPYTIERPPTAPSPVPTTNQSRDLDLHARDEDGNIVTMDGRKIDPSDHLPVDSWAPEPEPKGKDREKRTPVRDSRLTGAREPGAMPRHYGPGDASPTAMVRSSRYSKRQSQPFAAPGAYGAPPIPAKVPFGDGRASMDGGDMTALSEELRGIELGPAGTGRDRGRWRIRIGRV
ncbi:uncharacterized protein K452DRAFT_289791 [Aplosporella prunicola CBS 121167]|uniref:Uncharacterized protein n=1 Tax=Aplosporella prunicola CBS 121167 TaxID=1176127 RepID=A0A6A6B9S6_9PEZI|nr:uncharacterized protein K452DRAFT_289791 [Aplosporella prunicola CBS 121167]KAF2139241.1 hypothetical protein K452DRAFT_289791 [Aplosporella prunicola CBS 121167]